MSWTQWLTHHPILGETGAAGDAGTDGNTGLDGQVGDVGEDGEEGEDGEYVSSNFCTSCSCTCFYERSEITS